MINQQPTEHATTTAHKPKRGWLWRISSVLTLLLTFAIVAFGSGIFWLISSEHGLRFAITLPEKLNLGINIKTDTLKGSLWHGFSAQGIVINTPSADITASHLTFTWQAKQLFNQRHLHINELIVGDIHIDNKPTPPKANDQPLTLPEDLSLPITAAIDQLKIGKIMYGKARTVWLYHIHANYAYDHKKHLLNIHSSKTEWADSHGAVQIINAKPYALTGQLSSQGVLDGIQVDNQLNLAGSLQDVAFNTHIKGMGVSLVADTILHPFAPNIRDYIGHIKLQGKGINPQAFLSSLPKAKLTFDANVLPQLDNVIGLTGNIHLQNAQALPIDQSGMPIRHLSGDFMVNQSGTIQIQQLHAQLIARGEVKLQGNIDTQQQTLNLQAALKNITSTDAINNQIDGTLNGHLTAVGTFDKPRVGFQINTGRAHTKGDIMLLTDTKNQQRTIVLENGIIRPQDGGVANIAGKLELFQNQKLIANVNTQSFNPSKLYPNLPQGNINGNVQLTGEIANHAYQAQLAFRPSQLSGAKLSGSGKVAYDHQHLSSADLAVYLGNNVLKTQGSFGKKGDVLQVNIHAPNLTQFGFGLKGLAIASGSLKNTADGWTKVEADLVGQMRDFNLPNVVSIKTLDFKIKGEPEKTAPLIVSLDGKGIVSGSTAIDNAKVAMNGSLHQHQLNSTGSLKIDGKPYTLTLAANGGLNDDNQWLGTVSQLNVHGALNLYLQNQLKLEAGEKRVTLSPARWQALGGSLNLERFVWDKQTGLSTKGNANNLHLTQLHNFYTPPVEHDLIIASDWDLSYSRAARGYLNLRQQGGDVVLPTERKPKLLLENFILKTHLTENGIVNQFSGDTRYGKAIGNINVLQSFEQGNLMDAPVAGKILLNVGELNSLKNILPTGQVVKGKMTGKIDISGKLSDIKYAGSVEGENLYYRNHDAGVVLKDGSLKSRLIDGVWIVDALVFRRNGTATLTGTADYSGKTTKVIADVVFDHYQTLNQPNRNLTVSGKTSLTYDERGFILNGNLITDEGRFGFQESSAPSLDNDVVVLGETQPEKSESTPFAMNLLFDLNDKFYFSGEGLNVTLGGKLTLTTQPQQDIKAIGSVKVIEGRYKAYGQDLIIKKGIISFVGPLDKPNLDIRAQRRGSQVGAGVEVLGNLESPRIRLVADEPMSEKDKLSWLILNRASSGSSTDEASLATAAGAFLAGSLNDKVGLLDDFGLSSNQMRNAQTGEMNPAQQVLTFGKQLTRDLYLGYEAGLQTPTQSVKLIYQLSKSFQAVARLGTASSGGEIRYVKRFDGYDFGKKMFPPKPPAPAEPQP